MPIDEIEVPGSSISFKIWKVLVDSIPCLLKWINESEVAFDLEAENPGFHDCDSNANLVRGFYSCVVAFEVEQLVDGISTETQHRRIDTCEFLATDRYVFVTGRSSPQKPLARALSEITGYAVAPIELEFHQLSQFQDRLTQVKAIALINPKDKEIRRARLSGQIEDYTEYNVIAPREHGIESVSGLIESPIGPMTVTINRKGGLRLGVRNGFVLTVDCLLWLVSRIVDETSVERKDPLS